MKHKKTKILAAIAMMLCMAMLFTITGSAATQKHYGTYKDVDIIKNHSFTVNGTKYNCSTMQGLAVGSTWLYTAKIDPTNTYAVIFKTNRKTQEQVKLTNTENDKKYITGLCHANDMCVTTIDDKSTLFVGTCCTEHANHYGLVKLTVSGSKIKKTGGFHVKYNGNRLPVSGVSILEKTSSKIVFLIKNGQNIYKGSVATTAKSGTINVTKLFTVDKSAVTIDGKVCNLTNYVNQGFSYYNNKIYVPMSLTPGANPTSSVSVVAVYENVGKASGTIKASTKYSFRVTSKAYCNLFEIESCGICPSDGKLYFNTNRKAKADSNGVIDGNVDGIHYFKDYKAS